MGARGLAARLGDPRDELGLRARLGERLRGTHRLADPEEVVPQAAARLARSILEHSLRDVPATAVSDGPEGAECAERDRGTAKRARLETRLLARALEATLDQLQSRAPGAAHGGAPIGADRPVPDWSVRLAEFNALPEGTRASFCRAFLDGEGVEALAAERGVDLSTIGRELRRAVEALLSATIERPDSPLRPGPCPESASRTERQA